MKHDKTSPKPNKENIMNNQIAEVYEKTKDALLVDKHFGNEIADTFTGSIADLPTLVKGAISDGTPVKDILNKGLIAGMSIVGEKFKTNEIFVPEVLISAKAMQAG